MATRRIEITGAYTFDHPFEADPGLEVKVDRHSTSLQSIPSNWLSFCDAADDVLMPLAVNKEFYMKVGTVLKGASGISLLFALFIFFTMDMEWFGNVLNKLGMFSIVFFFAPFLVLLVSVVTSAVISIFFFHTIFRKVMENLNQVCTLYSIDGVGYRLNYDYSGIGKQKSVSKYFISVDFENNQELQPSTIGPLNGGKGQANNSETASEFDYRLVVS